MNHETIAENHIRLAKDAQDKLEPRVYDSEKVLIFILVWMFSAVTHALLAIAQEIRNKNAS